MSLAGCQINPIDVNFHLQKSLEIFDTNSADKIQSQNNKEVKVPCLMPIRVKWMVPNTYHYGQKHQILSKNNISFFFSEVQMICSTDYLIRKCW